MAAVHGDCAVAWWVWPDPETSVAVAERISRMLQPGKHLYAVTAAWLARVLLEL
jgi:hypothetical protein